MLGYKTIDQMTLKECADFMAQHEGDALFGEVKSRYKVLLNDIKRQEQYDYQTCETINDFDNFIAIYKSIEAYQAVHLDDAVQAKNNLVLERKRQEAEKRRKAQELAELQSRKMKRTGFVALLSLVAVVVVVFIIGYKPVRSLSMNDIVFGKEGGTKNMLVETNVRASAIDIKTPNEEWIAVERDGKLISITAIPNPDPERSCIMEIDAYSTFLGKRNGSPKSLTVIISQGSGYANHISLSERELICSQYGDSKIINVKTDGVKLQLSSPQSWIHVTPKEQRHDGQNYHDDDFVVSVDANPNESQVGTILVESGGKSREIKVSQASGYASELVSPAQLSFGKFAETRQIAVKTDGVSLQLTPSVDWITCRRIRHDSNQKYYHDDQYEIVVSTNSSGDKTGKILVQTGGKASEITVGQKSGLAKKLNIDRSSINYVDIRGTGYGKCFKVNVDTDGTSWSIRTNRGWIGTSKVGNTVEITVENNEGGDVRDGSVYISSNNGHKKTVDVHQDGNPTTFYSEYSRWTFDTERESKYITVNNNSHQPIQVSSNKKWLSAYMAGSSVKVSCESNNSSSRDGKITLTCGNKKTEISIHQKGWTSCTNGYRSWTDAFGGSFFYTYENGRHVLKHAYTSWEYNAYYGGTMPYPRVDVETCKACEGKGRIKQD